MSSELTRRCHAPGWELVAIVVTVEIAIGAVLLAAMGAGWSVLLLIGGLVLAGISVPALLRFDMPAGVRAGLIAALIALLVATACSIDERGIVTLQWLFTTCEQCEFHLFSGTSQDPIVHL